VSHVIGIDLGGTNFRLAVYENLHERRPGDVIEPVLRRREAVGDDRRPEAVVGRLCESIDAVAKEVGAKRAPVGIGFAGMLQGTDGFVANSPHFGWHDVPFGAMLREASGRKLAIDNDVNVICLGEARLGAAAGATDVLAVLAGTGIGGGILAGGKLITGGSGCAAEIGHTKVVLGEGARPCHCGKRGCVEAYLGGRNLRDRVILELTGGAESKAIELAGRVVDVQLSHLDEAAAQGDDYALDLYDEIAPLLGVVLANAITLLNPSHLVLGGGVLSRTPILKEQVLATMQIAANPPALDNLEVVDAALGDDAGLIGSALLALEQA